MQYFTGFFVEKSLAMDNVFVISLIFTYFAIPRIYQHRVLVWGILGVIVLRGVMIGLGAALISEFDWILFIFGGFLLITGIKMLVVAESNPDIAGNPILKFLRKRLNVTDELHGEKFFVRVADPNGSGKPIRAATPLFLALVLIEFADVVFAVDSVPAIFAITTDPYIVYTSNIFAILGLRALYFALAAMVHRFHYLKYALSLVLIFIGGKIFYNQFYGKLDPAISLSVTFALLLGGVIVSLIMTRTSGKKASAEAG
jgi:tellurite resistance protein TerC